jgi:nucleotide-binding universal stress UspA family protein
MSGILVGIDGSGHSGKALAWAAREAALRNVPLTVLTVCQNVLGYTGYAYGYVSDEELADRARQGAQVQADKVLGQLDEASRPASVTVRAVAGLPADRLLTAARDADMIVLGSRGAGGFRHLLLGSVAQQVTQHAHVPVVVIPADSARP